MNLRAAAPDRSADLSSRLAAIIQSSDDAIVSVDVQGTITSWNPTAWRMYGYTEDEAVGRSIALIVPPARRDEADDVLRRVLRGDLVEHFETTRQRKDGRELFVSLAVSPIRNARGEIIGASKIARDITAWKRQSVRAAFFADMGSILSSSLEYEATLANIARLAVTTLPGTIGAFADYSLVDIVEPNGELRRVAAAHGDPRLEPLLEQARRYAPDPERSLLARPLRTGLPLHLPVVTSEEVNALSRDSEHTRIMMALAPTTLITVPLTARGHTFGLFTVVRSERRNSFDTEDLAFALEVGRRAALAVDNARLYAEARQAVGTREQVLAIVSHDLRNALSAIATSARLLQAPAASEEQRTRRVQTIIRVCDRMGRLMQDLLDASRLQAGHALTVHTQPTEVVPLLRDSCEVHRLQAEDRLVTVECACDAPVPPVMADAPRIMQVLSNLVGNAIKFTPEGGTITLAATPIGSEVEITVSDTGPGIRAEDTSRIFERYWQATDTASLGTGLGLPIARGIVEAHGGRIWAESRAGVGATFHFTLPVA
jgi:PAS domain S-box-containing protein